MKAALLEKINELPSLDKKAKKRILVLISEGGGGHKVAGESLRDTLSEEYDVKVVNILTEITCSLDFLQTMTFGMFTAEDLYNFMLRKGYHRLANMIFVTLGNKYMQLNQERINKHFDDYLSQKQNAYDLVISTVPYFNGGIAKALQKRDLPFLILPTDLDTSTFFLGMKKNQFKEEDKIAFAFPYDDADLKKKGLRTGVFPLSKIFISGFPVRESCQKVYSPEEVLLLKLKHGMHAGRQTLTLILGASGNKKLLQYTQMLATLKNSDFETPLEFNICVGKNEQASRSILKWFLDKGAILQKQDPAFTSIKTSGGLLFHIRKFTGDLIEIMACSKLIITKTGSCSVNEAIYLGKKLLLDNTSSSSARYLLWETFNLHFVRKHGLGAVFCDLPEMLSLIQTTFAEDLGHPVSSGAFFLPDFQANIKEVVFKLLT